MVDVDSTIPFGEIADLTDNEKLNEILKKNFRNRELIGEGVWKVILGSVLEWSRDDKVKRHKKLQEYLQKDSITWIEALTATNIAVRKAALKARKEDYPE